MKDLTEVVRIMENAVLAISGSAQIDPAADWGSLKPVLPRLVKESIPLLARLHGSIGKLDEAARDQLLTELGKSNLQSGQSEVANSIILLILYVLILAYDLHKETVYTLEKVDLDVIDPPKDYWFQRVDGQASHSFFDGGLYLVNAIPPAGSVYFNSEIYNSPYTSIEPKNVTINSGLVDDPLTEPANFLYDIFLNRPYVAKNGTIFSIRAKAENLEGGSRGWGFWNTATDPLGMQIAWFVQFNGVEPDGTQYRLNGFWAQTQNGLEIKMDKLADLDEEWHDYRIEMRADSVTYFVDNRCVANVTDAPFIPSSPLSFHNWVDNAVFDIKNFSVEHVMQKTTKPRVNYTETMRIYSGPINPQL